MAAGEWVRSPHEGSEKPSSPHPIDSSSFRTCWLTVDWLVPSRCAAAVKLSVWATVRNVRNCVVSSSAEAGLSDFAITVTTVSRFPAYHRAARVDDVPRILTRLDPFILSLLATVAIASALPARGSGARLFSDLSTAGICLLFFLHGARLSPRAALDGLRQWRLHLFIFSLTFVDRKSTRLNSSHLRTSRMPSSA